MEFFHGTNIDFIGKRKYYFAFTAILTVISIYAFVQAKGPLLGLEFTGGTQLQIGFKKLPRIDEIRDTLSKAGWKDFTLQTQPNNSSIIISLKSGDKSKDDLADQITQVLKKAYAGNVKPVPDRVDYIGPVVGHNLVVSAYQAICFSLAAILVYVAFRFKNWDWGVGGVVALAHDVFMTWGLLTLLHRETTLVIVAALLTLAGYSINDTIVVFDRVRENLRTSRKESAHDIYNRSLNETLGRTINTSLTAFIASLSLYFVGGEVIHDFALAMSFGIFIGTYSSIGVALSLVYEIESRKKR